MTPELQAKIAGLYAHLCGAVGLHQRLSNLLTLHAIGRDNTAAIVEVMRDADFRGVFPDPDVRLASARADLGWALAKVESEPEDKDVARERALFLLRRSVEIAATLLRDGTPEDRKRAIQLVRAVLLLVDEDKEAR